MKNVFYCLLAFVFVSSAFAAGERTNTTLTPWEKQEIDDRLNSFYSGTSMKNEMDRTIPKIDVLSKVLTEPNQRLKSNYSLGDPLLQSSGKKLSPQFQKSRCEHLFKGKFPYLECEGAGLWDEEVQSDKVEGILRTWMKPEEIVRNLTLIPVKASIERPVWSGDYWRMRWGLTSYRYSTGKYFATYREAVDAYQQPSEWLKATNELSPLELSGETLKWSPSEKYDLLVGDEAMTLTQQQKLEGSYNLGEDGNVESWFGICHGWAPASFMVPAPERPVPVTSAKGTQVTWYPEDVRAIATLAWANGRFSTNFIGGRCNQKEAARFPNGRLSQPECFDNNPASFHLALANMIGVMKTPIIMDASFDYQVWNQPILSYEFQYFNPLDTTQQGTDWTKFAVAYDSTFKAKDRFQNPLTRGRRLNGGSYDDSKVNKIIGVIATVVYLAETSASHSPTPSHNSSVRATYTYDLELETNSDGTLPTGGEWHENRHPDFLWVPEKESVAKLSHDNTSLTVSLTHLPEPETTRVAERASDTGYPLCKVLESLVKATSASTSYRCGGE